MLFKTSLSPGEMKPLMGTAPFLIASMMRLISEASVFPVVLRLMIMGISIG